MKEFIKTRPKAHSMNTKLYCQQLIQYTYSKNDPALSTFDQSQTSFALARYRSATHPLSKLKEIGELVGIELYRIHPLVLSILSTFLCGEYFA